MSVFGNLTNDAIKLVCHRLTYPELYALRLTSTANRDIIKKFIKPLQIRLSDTITLRPIQGMLKHQFGIIQEGIVTFCAPKSFGKTITGCACVNDYTVICASSNTMRVWQGELKDNLNWYDPNPGKSKVLIYASTVRKHWEYLKSFPSDRKKAVILVSDCNLSSAMDIICKLSEKENRILIVDEAHYFRKNVTDELIAHRYGKCLLMSASIINPTELRIPENIPIKSISVGGLGKVPEVIWHLEKIYDQDSFEYVHELCGKHNKTAIVSTTEFLTNIQKQGIRHRKIYFQKSGVGTIPSFNNSKDKAVLLLNSNQNEGINVYANSIIIVNPSTMNTQRVEQTVARIVRTGNNNKSVHVYMLCNNEFALYRSIYARCHYSIKWPFSYEILPDEKYLTKSIQLIKVLGINPVDISPCDGCILFCDNSKNGGEVIPVSKIIEWWKMNTAYKYKTKLNEDIIKTIF